jgi:hypothetical protein
MDAEMMREFDEVAAAAGEELWPGEVVMGGVTYECAVVPPREPEFLGEGGNEPGEVELVVRIRKVALSTRPALHVALTWGGKRWKVRTVKGGEGDAAWCLSCEPNP